MTIPQSVADVQGAERPEEAISESPAESDRRAQAVAIVPELTRYRSTDDYFQGNGRDVVVVFDHDQDSVKHEQRRMSCGLIFILFLYLGPLTLGIILLTVLADPASISIGVVLVCFALWAIFGLWKEYIRHSRATMPHTAVNFDGVVHVDSSSKYSTLNKRCIHAGSSHHCFASSTDVSYFFPFSSILSIDIFTIRLVFTLPSYVEGATLVPIHRRLVGTATYSFKHLKHPLFFQKVVLAFKQHHRNARHAARAVSQSAANTELVSSGNLGESPTDDMLRTMEEQLNRQNGL